MQRPSPPPIHISCLCKKSLRFFNKPFTNNVVKNNYFVFTITPADHIHYSVSMLNLNLGSYTSLFTNFCNVNDCLGNISFC